MGKYRNDCWNKSGGMRSGFNYRGARNLASKVIKVLICKSHPSVVSQMQQNSQGGLTVNIEDYKI